MKTICGSQMCQAYCYQSHVCVPHVVLSFFFACNFIVILLHKCTLHQTLQYCITSSTVTPFFKCCIASFAVTPFRKCCTTFFCKYEHGSTANQLVYPRQLNSKHTFVSGTKYFVNNFVSTTCGPQTSQLRRPSTACGS